MSIPTLHVLSGVWLFSVLLMSAFRFISFIFPSSSSLFRDKQIFLHIDWIDLFRVIWWPCFPWILPAILGELNTNICRCLSVCFCRSSSWGDPNSKHWFTTSFLQPLPYFVTPWGPEDCQLTSNFFVVGDQTVVIKFVTNNSNKTRRVIYSRQQSLHQHKQNHNRLNWDGTPFFFFFLYLGWMCLVFTSVLGR